MTVLSGAILHNRKNMRSRELEPKKNFGRLLDRVQVNAPYRQLVGLYFGLFLQHPINPEIGFDAQTLDQFDEEKMAEVANLIKNQKRTVTFHGPFMDLAPGALDESIRKVSARRMQRTLDFVPLFGAQSVVFHAGYDDRRYHTHRQEWLSGSMSTWEPLVRRAEEIGVAIHLENVYEQTPEIILGLIREIASDNIGFCLDMGHLNAFGDVPLQAWLDALGPYLREIHLHDNDGHNDTHGPIGSGTAPFEEIFQYLSDTGMKPLITLEPHEEASLWKSLEILEQLWPWKD
jgi:sugar phosphate isomerase/epimerase